MTVTLLGVSSCKQNGYIFTGKNMGLEIRRFSSQFCDPEKNHWRSKLEGIIVIMLSTPRFDEKGNGGPEKSGDWPKSRPLRVGVGAGLWGESCDGEVKGENLQDQGGQSSLAMQGG